MENPKRISEKQQGAIWDALPRGGDDDSARGEDAGKGKALRALGPRKKKKGGTGSTAMDRPSTPEKGGKNGRGDTEGRKKIMLEMGGGEITLPLAGESVAMTGTHLPRGKKLPCREKKKKKGGRITPRARGVPKDTNRGEKGSLTSGKKKRRVTKVWEVIKGG